MSVVVFADGRRETIKVTPGTTLSQVLQQVCSKYNYQPVEAYGLKTQTNVEVDLSLPYRLSGLANGQNLTLIRKKTTTSTISLVNVALQFPSGERLSNAFPPTISLLDILLHFEKTTSKSFINITEKKEDKVPVFTFLNSEISPDKLSSTTLHLLGITSGTALFRVSYRVGTHLSLSPNSSLPDSQKQEINSNNSHSPIIAPKEEKKEEENQSFIKEEKMEIETANDQTNNNNNSSEESKQQSIFPKNIQVFIQESEGTVKPLQDVGEEFFEPSGEEVKRILAEEAKRKEENSILKTREMREREKQAKAIVYEKSDIRIRFPNKLIIQTSFKPSDTSETVVSFVKEQLTSSLPFYLFTTPPPTKLIPKKTLQDQNLVPSAVIVFAWEKGVTPPNNFLKEELMKQMKSSSEIQKQEEKTEKVSNTEKETNQKSSSSSSGGKSLPKWFQVGKKK